MYTIRVGKVKPIPKVHETFSCMTSRGRLHWLQKEVFDRILWENATTSLWIHNVSKHLPEELFCFKSSSIEHDVYDVYVNYAHIEIKIEDKARLPIRVWIPCDWQPVQSNGCKYGSSKYGYLVSKNQDGDG